MECGIIGTVNELGGIGKNKRVLAQKTRGELETRGMRHIQVLARNHKGAGDQGSGGRCARAESRGTGEQERGLKRWRRSGGWVRLRRLGWGRYKCGWLMNYWLNTLGVDGVVVAGSSTFWADPGGCWRIAGSFGGR